MLEERTVQSIHHYFNQFHSITLADTQALLDLATVQTFSRKSMMTVQGQIQKSLLIVLKGVQRSYYIKDDKEHVIAFTYPVQLSGIPESFLTQKPSDYFLEAITDTEVLAIPFEGLNNLFDTIPTVERLFRKITEAILVALIHRHYELLSTSAEERFTQFAARSPELFQMVPHKYIASYLRIDATNFSKLFNSIKI